MRLSTQTIIFILLISSCNVRFSDVHSEYRTEIALWLFKNGGEIYQQIEKDPKNYWFLYFDDALTCDACKLDILSQVRDKESIIIITNFSKKTHVEAFRKAYKLTNELVNIPSQSDNFSLPFLFRFTSNKAEHINIIDKSFLKYESIEETLKKKASWEE